MISDGPLQVVKYHKKYFEGIIDLWKNAYDSDYVNKRIVLFKWLTDQNPFAGDENPYFLLLDDNKVIGMVGHMPLEFTLHGKRIRGYLSHDILLAKEYRGRGLGKILVKGVGELAPLFAGAIWFNEPNYHLYQKSGWLNVKSFNPYLKIFNPTVFLKSRIRNNVLLKLASRVIKPILGIKSLPCISDKLGFLRGIQVSEINDFNDDIDILFDNVSSCFGIIVVRNRKYLNWKFIEKPFNKYKRYIAYDDKGDFSGYVVIKCEAYENNIRGKILDIFVHPQKPKVFRALIHKCVEIFSLLGVSYIEIVCTFPLFIRELKKIGFIKSNKPQRFMTLNWEGHFQKNFVEDIKNWYITYSEADGDSWLVDSTRAR
jgi:GNAT superfamily N-acetyltransferase